MQASSVLVGLVVGLCTGFLLAVVSRRRAIEHERDAFKALAGDALRETREDFLATAKETLGRIVEGDVGKRKEEIDALIRPIKDALEKVDENSKEIELKRENAYGSLERHLRGLTEAQQSLTNAMRRPSVRGRWGEMTLRNLVETCGLSQYCDFEEQPHLATEDGAQRPDMVVRLPGGRSVVIDAKAPLDAYLDAMDEPHETKKVELLTRHARQVRQHAQALGQRNYQDQFAESPDYVILFLPAESFFSAALEADHSLIEDALKRNVILTSPSTLVGLLRSIAALWRQEELTKSAQQVSEAGRSLYERMGILIEHLDGVRRGLDMAVRSFNSSVGSLESRVWPVARKFKELGVAANDLAVVEPIDQTLRLVPHLDEEAV